MQPVADPHQRAGHEPLQVQRVVVEHPLRLGVAGVVHLEAAVEQHPVDDVGADPAADGVAGLVHLDLEPRCGQPAGAGQARQARPHHDVTSTTRSP